MALDREGPLLLDGPVEVVMEDGTTVSSARFKVAVCTCRRSRVYPWCDTSHRRRVRAEGAGAKHSGTGDGRGGRPAGREDGR